MVKYISDQNRTVFQYESGTYGVVSGARQWLGLVQEHTVEPNMNVIPIRYQGSTDRNVDTFEDGRKEWNGTITYFPQDWKFLAFAIGSIQDLTGSHRVVETNSDNSARPLSPGSYPMGLHSFAIEDSKQTGVATNFVRTIIGGMVDSYQINFAQGDIVSAEIGYIAQNSTMSSGAVTAVSATTLAPFMFNDVTLMIPSGTGSVVPNLTEGTFSVNNNLERGFYLNGSRTAKELLPMNRDYEVTATAVMDTLNARIFYEDYYIAGSTFNASLMMQAAAGQGAGPGSMTVDMSGCKMTEMSVPSPLEGTQEQSFTFVPQHVQVEVYDSIALYNYA